MCLAEMSFPEEIHLSYDVLAIEALTHIKGRLSSHILLTLLIARFVPFPFLYIFLYLFFFLVD